MTKLYNNADKKKSYRSVCCIITLSKCLHRNFSNTLKLLTFFSNRSNGLNIFTLRHQFLKGMLLPLPRFLTVILRTFILFNPTDNSELVQSRVHYKVIHGSEITVLSTVNKT